ncbi:MAG: 50S ribosomal protein L11 methyltransferase [Bacteroidia bacterium]|nr:50S ribosomal protein L11 methyltransferase [Bacteroidia bacterium]
MSNYILCKIPCSSDLKDILIAELAEINFEGFLENDEGFEAYLPETDYSEQAFFAVLNQYELKPTDIDMSVVAQQNWNAEWEQSFEPVCIGSELRIRAPFHESDQGFPIELVIQPKTSFGTGHHETTFSIMQLMLEMDFNNKSVFDYGSGTGILAILAAKLGAQKIIANDIDTWAAENILENIALNSVQPIEFIEGDLHAIPNQTFDIILANINRNILMESFASLFPLLASAGKLVISGFYTSDLPDLQQAAENTDFKYVASTQQNNWTAAVFTK